MAVEAHSNVGAVNAAELAARDGDVTVVTVAEEKGTIDGAHDNAGAGRVVHRHLSAVVREHDVTVCEAIKCERDTVNLAGALE